ncbi:hypothetical protein BJ170DRAFT_578335 [Xylariales sp. AK1849]|nr:hypothetical protein BJ170DRAFT_578335 [Xylariales sp. AK1849]
MNRFRTKKKVKDESLSSHELESPSGFRFRKGKKSQEEQKPIINLAAALPSSDDFRTSLLMTGLSARFSMLREQDDPNTKIGKASDDSVLLPTRQSRMMDLGSFRGLSDIAEVESIKAPFARMDSYSSDADSVNGSIMSRAKPVEGNNLFGGRQKIYKIPVGATSSKTLGGMGGRALYDDDVATSAFQKWKKAERERKSFEDESEDVAWRRPSTDEPEVRPESPFSNGYNRKRETSSTTSSVPSMARNSTAATSVTSQQPASSAKESQSFSTAPTSASSTSGPERSFTRTRRLYETGLNHDLHEQQSSALSRIDTLSRRPLGSRTPDLSQNSPSPTAAGFAERFGGERRILTKASAPNLRSMSPASRSSAGTPDLGIRVPSVGENRATTLGSPPLSPPISEEDEIPGLSIQPNDRGKATALGVFQKPAQPYDESRFAQRQLQLQQGRETPTQRFRTESNASLATERSISSSSVQRQASEPKTEMFFSRQSSFKKEVSSPTFFYDDSEESPVIPSQPTLSPHTRVARPSDRDHPAFRGSAMPTPLSMASGVSGEPSPTMELLSTTAPNDQPSPADSPTLGPTTGASAGLSGMVRQHLRADSGASSIYGMVPATSGLESRFPLDPEDTRALRASAYGTTSNPWESQDNENDWTNSYYGMEPESNSRGRSTTLPNQETFGDQPAQSSEGAKESDEFASQLADGARRIRERLTTYVETDSRSTSPQPSYDRELQDTQPPARSNALGLLKSKSSKGSLNDRSRDAGSQSKAMKLLGMGDPPAAPFQKKHSFDVPAGLPPMKEEAFREQGPAANEDDNTSHGEEQHAGIRAFRQARRELQRLKELETQERHHHQPQAPLPEPPAPRVAPVNERGPGQRSPSRERKPPPVMYRQRAPSEESYPPSSRSASQGPSSAERNRSGSNSSGERAQHRPPMRLRNGSSPSDDRSLAPNGHPGPMLRSPGLPGTNIRRSPHMPPQPYPAGSPARMNQANYGSNNNLHVQHHRGYDSGQPSPISPLPPSLMASGPTTPNALPSPQRPPVVPTPGVNSDGSEVPGLNDAMKRRVRPRDISEPKFVMSTSRVPTVELPPAAATNRSRSNSRSGPNSKAEPYNAPPLPPINPRRRQDGSTRTRTVFGNLVGRKGEMDGMASASTPNLPNGYRGAATPSPAEEGPSPFSASEDGDPMSDRRPLRKMHSDNQFSNPMMRVPSNNSPAYNIGPPASRMVVNQGGNRGMGLPGGMI